jgi:diadenosine tetraphosphatase ApaH/serine/threonine PP2A family protein phosphatase
MEIAVISDIHANAEALAAVFVDISVTGAEKIAVLGDVVGYGADPEVCTRAIMVVSGDEPDAGIVPSELLEKANRFRDALNCAVMGNHDMALFDDEILTMMRYEAVEAVQWQRKKLSAENVSFHMARPLEVEYGDAVFVHASPYRPETFGYIVTHYEAANVLSRAEGRLFFIGHTHDPTVFNEDGIVKAGSGGKVLLNREKRYIVNVGSVGQPRDGDPRSSYVIWDTERETVEFRRVEYDVETAARKIYDAGLPRVLGDRLFAGI